jgi:hypothetical protein
MMTDDFTPSAWMMLRYLFRQVFRLIRFQMIDDNSIAVDISRVCLNVVLSLFDSYFSIDFYIATIYPACIMTLEGIVRRGISGLGRFAQSAVLGLTLLGSGYAVAQSDPQEHDVLLEFLDDNSQPIEFLVPESASATPVSSVGLDFKDSESAKMISLNPVDPQKLYTGHVRVTPKIGEVFDFPQFAEGGDGQCDTVIDIVKTSTGFSGRLTYQFNTGSEVFTAALLESRPVTSFRIPSLFGDYDGTAMGLVCGSDTGCNLSLTFFYTDGSVFDRAFKRMEKGDHRAYYVFEAFSKKIPEYGVLDVVSDGFLYAMALHQHRNSFTVTPVFGGVGKGSAPGVALVDLLACPPGGADSPDFKGCPRIGFGDVSFRSVADGSTLVFPVNADGSVSLVPKGGTGPVLLKDGKYERVVSADGYIMMKQNVVMPSQFVMLPMVDGSKINTKLDSVQWNVSSHEIHTNFFAATDKIWKCYLNTSGLTFDDSMMKVVRANYKDWCTRVLPQHGIRTEYIESENTPLPDWDWEKRSLKTHVPDYTMVLYQMPINSGIYFLEGKVDEETFEMKGVSVGFGNAYDGGQVAVKTISSEYPMIFGFEDQEVQYQDLIDWGLTPMATIVIDSNSPGVYPTAMDEDRITVKKVLHRYFPGTRIVLPADAPDYYQLPERKE